MRFNKINAICIVISYSDTIIFFEEDLHLVMIMISSSCKNVSLLLLLALVNSLSTYTSAVLELITAWHKNFEIATYVEEQLSNLIFFWWKKSLKSAMVTLFSALAGTLIVGFG